MPRVSIPSMNKEFTIDEGEVLYDAIHDQGLELPHGCLAGSCGACRIEILKGKENLKDPSTIEKNTVQAICEEQQIKDSEGRCIRLSCRARVFGDVVFEPLKK